MDLKLSVWDTAGQEIYSGLKDGYYIQSKLAVVFYDTTNLISFKNVANWINKIRKVDKKMKIILCGTKTNLPIKVFYNGKTFNSYYMDHTYESCEAFMNNIVYHLQNENINNNIWILTNFYIIFSAIWTYIYF